MSFYRNNFNHKKHLRPIARGLRKRMTEAEVLLWVRIKGKQINNLQYYRQRPIGEYIVDFYCPAEKIIIEVDGNQHFENKGRKEDNIRDTYFKKLGIKVIRFYNYEIFKYMESVLERIYQETL